MANELILSGEESVNFMPTQSRTAADVGLNLIAELIRKKKGDKQQEIGKADLQMALDAKTNGDEKGAMEILLGSKNSKVSALGSALMGKQIMGEDKKENPYGSGFEANLYNLALKGDPNDPETQAAYQQLSSPKTNYDPSTGKTWQVSAQVPKVISDRFNAPSGNAPSNAGTGPVKVLSEGKGDVAPQAMQQAYLDNSKSLRQAQQLSSMLESPDQAKTLGKQNMIPGVELMYQLLSPESTDVRGLISALQSMTYKTTSGQTVSAAEEKRLSRYVPIVEDQPEVAKQKAKNFVKEFDTILKEQEALFKSSNYRIPDLPKSEVQTQAPQGTKKIRNTKTGQEFWYNESTKEMIPVGQ